jgi:hypothetical protein
MARLHPRRYPRLTCHIFAAYSVGNGWSRCKATVGGGGLFLNAVTSLELGSEVSIRFRPAKHLPVIRTEAKVLYIIEGAGTGVEFKNITAEDRLRLLRVIHRYSGDRRTRPRAPLATQVQCKKCYSLAFSRDLSLSGMFVETHRPLSVGSRLTVRFNLNHKDRVVIAAAHVHYHLAKMGMGILFDGLLPDHQHAIEEYIESHQNLFRAKPADASYVV